MKKNGRTMKIDSVYNGPTQSSYMKSINGGIQRDKRIKMNHTLTGVNHKLDSF